MPRYRFEQFAGKFLVTVSAGYATVNIINGEAELDPANDHDKTIIEEFGGVLFEEKPVKKSSKKETN